MKIAIGSDHVGYELKGKVIAHLKEKGIEVKDFGTRTAPSVPITRFTVRLWQTR